MRKACSPPWVGRQGRGTSRGARSAEHPGDIEAEVGEAAERSPHKRDAGATGVCRDHTVFSADETSAKGTSALTLLAISDFGSS